MNPAPAIVVGFDQHPSSAAALRFAIELSAPLDAHLHVVHIADLDDFPVDPDSPDYEDAAAAAIADESSEARALLGDSQAQWTYYTERGIPAKLLARKADEVEAVMIVVGGSRGGGIAMLERLSGGSVSTTLALHAHRPVVIVPAEAEHADVD